MVNASSSSSKKRDSARFHNPFDGKPVKGRSFTKKELEDRRRFFSGFFNIPLDASIVVQ